MFDVRTALLCLSTLCCMVPLRAEEVRTGVPLPGLTSDPTGTVRSDSVNVSLVAGMVSVALATRVVGEAPALLLTGPLFGWSGPSDPYPDRHFPELRFLVGGAATTPEDSFVAFAGKANVTTLLRTGDIDPWTIARTPPLLDSVSANGQLLKGLQNFGAIEASGDRIFAKWTAQRIVRLPLKPAVDQQVELNYRARPAESSLTINELDTRSREKAYCISPNSLSRLPHSGLATPPFSIAEYAVAAGIDGKAPASVTLTVSPAAGAPPAYVFFCGTHGKPVAKKGSLKGEPAEVDDAGVLYIMTVTAR